MAHPRLSRLANVKARAERILIDTCSIITTELVSDGAGGFTESTSSSSSNCLVQTTGSDRERVVAERMEGHAVATLLLPAGTSIDPQYTVGLNGTTYQVQNVSADDTVEVLREIIVSRRW